jgi:hypothetical protein
MSWLWRWMSRLWLQRLRLRRLRRRRLGRLRLRRLLLIVGRLPFLLIRGAPCWASTSEDFLAGSGGDPANSCAHHRDLRACTTELADNSRSYYQHLRDR